MTLYKFITYLDILGFSEKVEKTELNLLVNEYRLLIDNALKLCLPEVTIRNKKIETWQKSIQWARASDTILIYTTDETDIHFEYLIKYTLSFIFHCFTIHYPIRGAIDYGEFYYDKHDGIYIGRSLINAHKVAEKQDWAGIILSDDCIKKINSETKLKQVMEKLLLKKKIIKYNVPLKDANYIERYILNWAPSLNQSHIGHDVIPLSEEEFREIFLPEWIYDNTPVRYNIEKKIQNTYQYYLAHYKDRAIR